MCISIHPWHFALIGRWEHDAILYEAPPPKKTKQSEGRDTQFKNKIKRPTQYYEKIYLLKKFDQCGITDTINKWLVDKICFTADTCQVTIFFAIFLSLFIGFDWSSFIVDMPFCTSMYMKI